MRYFIYARKSTESDDRQVLSIDSQKSEIRRAFEGNLGIEIVDVFEESKSAKAPGRVIFAQMMAQIEQGEADGIIAWHPDRLSRNSIDGGRIIYFLDTGVLRDLKFVNFTFENNPQGKLMLQVLLGFSKYYVDSLSENVKRGNRAKVERGWRPGNVPLGYRNDRDTRTIVPDEPHFSTVKRLLTLMATGAYNVRTLLRMANVDWGYRLPERGQFRGQHLAMSTLYKALANPFYAGQFLWNGRLYQGAHEPMISMAMHREILRLLGKTEKAKPKEHSFPFTGLLRCGVCNLMVTAEHKVKPSGRQYTYYHCTKRGNGERCRQPSVSAKDLEKQLAGFVREIDLPSHEHVRYIAAISRQLERRDTSRAIEIDAIDKTLTTLRRERRNVDTMRAKDQLSEVDYLSRSRTLDAEIAMTEESRRTAASRADPFELDGLVVSFRPRAVEWFSKGSGELKRLLLQTIGSNYRLKDRIVSAEAVEPFFRRVEEPRFLYWCGVGDDVRTAFEPQEFEKRNALARQLRHIMSMAEVEGLEPAPLPLVADAPESSISAARRAA